MTGDSKQLVAEIPIRDGEVIRIMRDLSHDRWRVVMREWFRDAGGEWRPGRSGIAIKREIAALPCQCDPQCRRGVRRMSRIPRRAEHLLPLIGSPVDGEALAACRALKRTLAAVGCDLHDLAAAIVTIPEAPPRRMTMPASHFDLCCAVRDLDGGRLSYAERQFVDQMCRHGNRLPSPRQAAWLGDLYVRLRRVAA